ncbi:MAG: hypothetical protein ACE5G0_19730 [Rhodothermales bacterium]
MDTIGTLKGLSPHDVVTLQHAGINTIHDLWVYVGEKGVHALADRTDIPFSSLLKVLTHRGEYEYNRAGFATSTDLWDSVGNKGIKAVSNEKNIATDRLKGILVIQGLHAYARRDVPLWRRGWRQARLNGLVVLAVLLVIAFGVLLGRALRMEKTVVVSTGYLPPYHLIMEEDVEEREEVGIRFSASTTKSRVVGRYTLKAVAPGAIIESNGVSSFALSAACSTMTVEGRIASVRVAAHSLSLAIPGNTVLLCCLPGEQEDAAGMPRLLRDICVLEAGGEGEATSITIAVPDDETLQTLLDSARVFTVAGQ